METLKFEVYKVVNIEGNNVTLIRTDIEHDENSEIANVNSDDFKLVEKSLLPLEIYVGCYLKC